MAEGIANYYSDLGKRTDAEHYLNRAIEMLDATGESGDGALNLRWSILWQRGRAQVHDKRNDDARATIAEMSNLLPEFSAEQLPGKQRNIARMRERVAEQP